MRASRRRRGFERAGSVPAARLGLPGRRARELSLLQAWRGVAGEALARHARAVAVVRGVLEIEAADRRWHDAVRPLLPQLAARLAAEAPALGVKRFRLRASGDDAVVEAVALPDLLAAPPQPEAVPHPAAPAAARPRPATAEELAERLQRVVGRYVRRGGGQKA